MIRAYFRNQRGAAAAEFALVVGVFAISLPSVVDLGIYAYDAMQVQNSAQMGVQAIWAACSQLPASDSTACPKAWSALTAAVQQTSLGSSVSVSQSDVTEGYYCATSTGLEPAGGPVNFPTSLSSVVPTPPIDCSTVTNATTSKPGDYIGVTVSYTYTPVFSHVSVASLLGTTIKGTAWMRLL